MARPARADHRGCGDLAAAAGKWRALVREAVALPLGARIAFVNVEINRRIVYRPDGQGDSGVDHWSTPCETLARGCGDCEDFAIAKHFLLAASGVPAPAHRLLYARYRASGRPGPATPHLAAVVRAPFADPWVLDQINPRLLALSSRDDLEPLFSFDAASVWCAVDEQPLPRGPLRASRWIGVLERMRLQQN